MSMVPAAGQPMVPNTAPDAVGSSVVAGAFQGGALTTGIGGVLTQDSTVNVWAFMSASQQASARSWTANNDITTAINNAIATMTNGGVLILPPGRTYTQGNHSLPANCSVIGYGKATLTQPSAPTSGVSFLESGVDTNSVFTFGGSGLIRDCSIVDTIVATRTSGDAVVCISTDVNQRVDMTGAHIYGFWNGYNGRVTNGCSISGNNFVGCLNYCVVLDNEVSSDAGDNTLIGNDFSPGFTGKTAAAAIHIRNGGNKVIGNTVVKNAGTLTNGILADIRSGTGQLLVNGNKIESVAAEPIKITYAGGSPSLFGLVEIVGNVFVTTSGTAAAIDADSITTFTIGANVLSGGGTNALNINNSSGGTILPNTNNGFTNNYDANALANSTKSYWDSNPLYVGDSTTNNGVRLTASSGSLSIGTAFSNTATDVTAGKFFISGSTSGRPSDTDLSFTKAYNPIVSGNQIVLNTNGSGYGVIGVDSGGDRWYFGTSSTGLTSNLTVTALSWTINGNVVVGSAAIATNATNGFLYIPTCAGAPTGVPVTYTGRSAMVYDTTNNKLMVYNGAWKGVTLT